MTEQIGIFVAIIGYLILAVSTLFDKFLVTKTFKNPTSYAFWLGLLGLLAFALLPFDFALPQGIHEWAINFAAGAAYTLSILYYTRGLFSSDPSFALPIVGSLATVFTGLFAYFLLGERLSQTELLAITVLLAGFWVMMTEKSAANQGAISNFVAAAIFFGIANVSTKFILTNQPFFSGLAFSRIGGAAVSLLLLALPSAREAILQSKTVLTTKNIIIILFGNGLGALGIFGIFFAYQFSSPTILNALQGIQYAFLALLAYGVTLFWPTILQENINRKTLLRKSIGISIIIFGAILLAKG